jgi:hypothetical protein
LWKRALNTGDIGTDTVYRALEMDFIDLVIKFAFLPRDEIL